MTQKETIKKHLLKKPITTIDAFEKYKITRLSAHIHSLRKEGYIIKGERKENKKNGTWWIRYSIDQNQIILNKLLKKIVK